MATGLYSTTAYSTPCPASPPALLALLATPADDPRSPTLALRSAGEKLHLVAERSAWALWLAEDGSTASLLHDSADDLGTVWSADLTDLVALLNDPRIAGVIRQASLHSEEQ